MARLSRGLLLELHGALRATGPGSVTPNESQLTDNRLKHSVVRLLIAGAVSVFYAVAGWILLAHLVSSHDATPAPPGGESHSAGVTITISVVDGPTLYCDTSADRTATDTIAVTGSHVRD